MYIKILDVWEGNLESNEDMYTLGGVAGLIIRLNDMSGGHHRDINFDKQWNESQKFNPAPYFVYNPWVDGVNNFNWLSENCPPCPTVFIDVEVRYPNYPASTYGAELRKCVKLCKTKWHTVVYCGAGKTTDPNFIDYWPTDVEYWWAQYPYPLYKSAITPVKNISWAELDTLLAKLPWPPVNGKYSPGVIKLHQCSGDRFIVPGNTRPMDVSIWPGTPAEYATWIGWGTPLPPPELTLEEKVACLLAAHPGLCVT
jgi:hypothetical protein